MNAIIYWPWGVIITSAVTVTIWMNGHHWRSGWLVGAGSQLAQIGFGAVILGVWTFWFAAAPMLMFLWNWWQHPKREAALRRRYGGVVVDVAGSDQLVVMSRGVFDQLKAPVAPPLPDLSTIFEGLVHGLRAVPPLTLPPLFTSDSLREDIRKVTEDIHRAQTRDTPKDSGDQDG
jgi:hypothetical protein